MSYNFVPFTEEEKEFWFRAEMNKCQFKALCNRLENSDIENEIFNNIYYQKVSKSASYSNMEVVKWLKSSWNTERILHQNIEIVENTNQSFCMQWAFPQAYYAVFTSILAMFKTIGYTENSHTAVLKKYVALMVEKKIPDSISLCCDGIEKNYTYLNIDLPDVESNIALDLDDQLTVDHHICQFLRATRRLRLKEKAPQMNFKTKSGDKRKNLNQEHWEKVSDSIGPTGILDFLYRKRIKGNYQDIETYNTPYFDGKSVLHDLISIVDRMNLVNESYISKAIGIDNFKQIVENNLKKVQNDKLEVRLESIEIMLKASR